MNPFAVIARLLAPRVSPEAIRLEIFLLGARHRGEALGGALLELKSAGLAPDRGRLLRAVVAQLS